MGTIFPDSVSVTVPLGKTDLEAWVSEHPNYHRDQDCTGDWRLVESRNFLYSFDCRGIAFVEKLEVVHCRKCGSTFIPKETERKIVEEFEKVRGAK